MSGAGLDPGRLCIRVSRIRGEAGAVEIDNERAQVTGVLRGKLADEAIRAVPLLFSVCGHAQGRAAELALRAARGEDTKPITDANVRSELVREHLWRLMLDLPPLVGLTAVSELFVAAQRALARNDKTALLDMLNNPFWLALQERTQSLPTAEVDGIDSLPVMSASQSLEHWPRLTRTLAQQPNFKGKPALTGAYARAQAGPHGTLRAAALWEARLAEVRKWATGDCGVDAGGTASAVAVAAGIGRSLVDTARGLLMHEVTLDGDRIADYVIVAPTEWNFHPRGILTSLLTQASIAEPVDLRNQITQWVTALDPCVRWELSLSSDALPGD